jgi:mevalonate kinase
MSFGLVEARSPGKLIILGEHAVVSGAPALSLALKRYTYALLEPQLKAPEVSITSSFVSKASWGPYSLNQPELPSYFLWAKKMIELSFPEAFDQGMNWSLRSEILPGHGMGSSAAAICASFWAMQALFQRKKDKKEIWPFLTSIESICHGKSSGIDVATSLQGGFIRFQQGEYVSLDAPDISGWYFLDCGRPLQSTKECVLHSQQIFAKDSGLLKEMWHAAEIFIQRLFHASFEEISRGIKHWHTLQKRLGVVPQAIGDLIDHIERAGASAKVCGAGALSGEGAGLVLVLAPLGIAQELKRDGLKLHPVEVDHEGSYITLLG